MSRSPLKSNKRDLTWKIISYTQMKCLVVNLYVFFHDTYSQPNQSRSSKAHPLPETNYQNMLHQISLLCVGFLRSRQQESSDY